ncbi:hypothetical protein D3C76_1561980 [compost metagenome]
MDMFVATVNRPGVLHVLCYVEITHVETGICSCHIQKTADPKQSNFLQQMTVSNQIKTLITWNEIIGIDIANCDLISCQRMILSTNGLLA